VQDAAWLVIGDQALKMAAQPGVQQWSYVTDLATAWWDWQKLPFVFARWIVRRDAPTETRQRLEQVLQSQFEKNMADLAVVSEEAAAKVGLSSAVVRTYLEGFENRLGADAERAIAIFKDLNQRSLHVSGSLS
jgi:chorismate dehydratase